MKKQNFNFVGISASLLGLLLLKKNKEAARVGAIFNELPELLECADGSFSSARSSRACNRRGGQKTGLPITFGGGGSGLLNIQDIALDQIKINRELFQGREKAFSKRSVDNIVTDAQAGRFAWENLDPITLWRSPEGELFLLSGHSRLKAFETLAESGVKVDGKGFTRIPAKIRTGSLQSAQRMALESNTLSTKETDIERAAYYRRLRQDGEPEKSILTQCKKNEGRNWANIYAFTFLSPTGRTWATLKQFSEGEDQSATLAKTLAKWIGSARREIPQLTNEHEGELHAWLFDQKGYGTGSGQVSNERDFQERVQVFVQKNTFFGEFDQDKPLNILSAQQKSPTELEYDRAISEKTKQLSDLDKEMRQKIKVLTDRRATASDIARIIQPYETGLRNLRVELSRLLQKKNEVIEYSKNEIRLFGIQKNKIGGFPRYL
jgi:hypothetical protein